MLYISRKKLYHNIVILASVSVCSDLTVSEMALSDFVYVINYNHSLNNLTALEKEKLLYKQKLENLQDKRESYLLKNRNVRICYCKHIIKICEEINNIHVKINNYDKQMNLCRQKHIELLKEVRINCDSMTREVTYVKKR